MTPTLGLPTDSASEALRISEARYRRLFETARDGILLLNVETAQIEDVNPYLIEMLGYSHAEFLGKKLWEVGPFADIAQSKEMFAVLQVEGYVRYDDLPLKTKGGCQIPVEFVSNSYDCEGIKVIQCNVSNISERKRADEALRVSAMTLKNISQGVLVTDANRRIASANIAFSKITGYNEQEILGLDCKFLQGPLTDPEVVLQISQSIKAGSQFDGEILNYRKDGTVFWNELTVSPVRDAKGVIVQFIGVIRDITERIRALAAHNSLELQLRESQKMEAIGTLAGGIAHDFNNIIAAILGNTELARQDTELANKPALESLEEIRKAGTRASKLVQQILSFSRKQPMERIRISLAPVVEESARLLRATLPARVSLTVELGTDIPDIIADATQIEQILINLGTNAAQAAGSELQKIVFCLDCIALDSAAADNLPALKAMHAAGSSRAVRLRVGDAGPGIDQANLTRIFEPFFTTKLVGEGSGLGLAVVHGIVKSHEGLIMVESELGKGTTFIMYFPSAPDLAATLASQPPAVSSDAKAVGSGRRLLYIDDDDALIYLVKRMLERHGFIVSGYTDPREALKALRAEPDSFDIVVTDYNMPFLSGLDVARAVRNLRPGLPIAIASGFIDSILLAQAEESGARELIVKAATIEIYCEAIERLVQSTRQVRTAQLS
jgi:two-component system, cell cycle sensor histidine kinase and response regulator CckA